jgi:TRAP-type mannitol/chloroaromatic compound transport system permease small subunit
MTQPVAWTPEMEVGGGRTIDRFDRILGSIERFTAIASGIFIFILMLVGVSQILGRKLFNMPIFGYIDAVEMSIAVFAFLAIAYCERVNGHVRMELFVGKLKGKPLWLAEAAGQVLGLFVLAVLIYFGWDHAMRAYEYGDSTIDAQIPWWPSKMLIPFAFGMLFLRLALNLVGYVRLFLHSHAEPVAVPLIADVRELAKEEAAEAGVIADDEDGTERRTDA